MEDKKIAIVRVKHCYYNNQTGEYTEKELTPREVEKWIKENMKEREDDNTNI